jgi:hypothetical protein
MLMNVIQSTLYYALRTCTPAQVLPNTYNHNNPLTTVKQQKERLDIVAVVLGLQPGFVLTNNKY